MNGSISLKLSQFKKILSKFPELTYVGNSVLRTPTLEVKIRDGVEISRRLEKTLIEYRKLTGIGRGLAAPQIGLSKRVFITYIDNEVQTYINPIILRQSSTQNYFRELCLSSGLMWADVKRSESITLQWQDKNGKQLKKGFSGLLARLIQHEYDHLEGVVNLDQAEVGSIEFALSDPLKERLRPIKL